ncbi:hypothetical protein TNCV_4891911 [Trichonephila clavipes]|nr:hypothetical protein TNCV_4891911 [Trichonephila clavipes]
MNESSLGSRSDNQGRKPGYVKIERAPPLPPGIEPELSLHGGGMLFNDSLSIFEKKLLYLFNTSAKWVNFLLLRIDRSARSPFTFLQKL